MTDNTLMEENRPENPNKRPGADERRNKGKKND